MFLLGKDAKGVPVFASPRSHLLALGPPRSGKTTGLVIPNVCSFPGPVVTTSTKPDILEATARVRGAKGRLFLFDPSGEVAPQKGVTPLVWSPIENSATLDDAVLMAETFVRVALAGQHGESLHWVDRAKALLSPLLLAANLGEFSVFDLARWVDLRDVSEPLDILTFHGAERAREVLESVMGSEERERSAVFSTCSASLGAYRFSGAYRQGEQLDVKEFLASSDCLYIVSSGLTQQMVAPVVVSLLDAIRVEAYRRKDTRCAFILDELANIAPLPTLGGLLSEGVSQGISLLGVIQDLSQAHARWPGLARGFFTLFGTTVVLGGIGDLETLRTLEELFGSKEVTEFSYQQSLHVLRAQRSRSQHRTREPTVDRHQLATLPFGEAWVLDLRGRSGRIQLLTPGEGGG